MKLSFWTPLTCLMFISNVCYGGGCLPGEDCNKVAAQPMVTKQQRYEPVHSVTPVECSGWGSRLAAGAPVWFFEEEDTEIGGGIYYDVFSNCKAINFRVGGEVSHISANQPNALASAERPGTDAQLTFVRVPFALEYMTSVADNTFFFLGGGPDIIHTANDIGDTSVGMHVSARLLYNFTNDWGVAVEAGHMWGEVEARGGDVDLDNTFVIPSISYTF